jgi:hypothetical protein
MIEAHIEQVQGKFRDGKHPIYRLTQPLTYKELTAPAGFETDLATRFMFSAIIAPPKDKRIWAAAAIHDYSINQNRLDIGNDYFSEILKINRVPLWRRWLMVTFVRWWTV